MAVGASGLAGLIIVRLAAKHGWTWVQSQLKARAAQAEAAFRAKVSAAAGDLAPRITALESRVRGALEGDLAKVKEDIAALQAKVPH
jgi:hypothetical protein